MAKNKKKEKKSREGSRFYRVCYAIFAGIVGFLFRIRVVGAENEPDTGRFVVCANHVSAAVAVVQLDQGPYQALADRFVHSKKKHRVRQQRDFGQPNGREQQEDGSVGDIKHCLVDDQCGIGHAA